MYTGVIAARYAKALFMLAQSNGEEKTVYEQAEKFCIEISENSSIRNVLSASILPKSSKIEAIQTVFDGIVCESLYVFIKLVFENHREKWLIFMLSAYRRLYEEKNRILRASLTTVSAIGESNIEHIVSMIKSKTGCSDVNITYKRDESIIGGFVLQIGDCLIDASLKSQLSMLRCELEKR